MKIAEGCYFSIFLYQYFRVNSRKLRVNSRKVFLYDKEPNWLSYSNDLLCNCVMLQILTTAPLTPVSTGHVRIQEPPTAARVMPAGPDKTVVKVTDSMLPYPDTSLKTK